MPLFDPPALQRQIEALPPSPPAQTEPTGRTGSSTPKWPYAVLLAGQGADIVSTLAAMRNPNMQEGNPLGLAPVLGLKAAYTAGLAALMHHQAQNGHPNSAKWIGILGGLTGAVPAAWNIRQLSR